MSGTKPTKSEFYPWTADETRNTALSDQWTKYYTIRYCGLVRGQILGAHLAKLIVAQLNLANVDGANT